MSTLKELDLNQPVTHYMRRDVARLRVDQSVGEALAQMRQQPPGGRIVYFYVVDVDDRLQGVVPTRRLLLSTPETPIADIMVRQVIRIPDHATALEACEFFILHRFLAFPIVDAQDRLVGIVDMELYTTELNEAARLGDDLFQVVGVYMAQERQASPFAAYRSRFPWLLCNVLGGILAAFLAGHYEAELQKVVALALFIPVVLALAESVSIQSVSIAVELLHGRQPTWKTLMQQLRKEVLTGILLGLSCGILVGIVAWIWLGEPRVAFCLWGGIAAGVTCAAILGMAMPNLLRFLQRDPQVAAGPVALTLADIATLLIYFNLARLMF